MSRTGGLRGKPVACVVIPDSIVPDAEEIGIAIGYRRAGGQSHAGQCTVISGLATVRIAGWIPGCGIAIVKEGILTGVR